MRFDFRDEIFQGDTLRRAVRLRNRQTFALESLEGYTASYTARLMGADGPAQLSASVVGSVGEAEIAPLLATAIDVVPGTYDAWVRLSAPGGALVATKQGVLEVRIRPT